VNGVRLHYVIGGRGAPLVLLPGYPETWWEYRKVMPALAARYRVIAVDLRGMGGSGKPRGGFDKKTMAKDVLGLVRHLGYDQVNIAGHDIGSQVTFSFAANHPGAATRIAMLDVPHPNEFIYSLSIIPRPGQPAFFTGTETSTPAPTTRPTRSGQATAGIRPSARISPTWQATRSSIRRSWPCTPTPTSRVPPPC
jgi:pimeloyl-ACP methyl ester carboxylesterase